MKLNTLAKFKEDRIRFKQVTLKSIQPSINRAGTEAGLALQFFTTRGSVVTLDPSFIGISISFKWKLMVMKNLSLKTCASGLATSIASVLFMRFLFCVFVICIIFLRQKVSLKVYLQG